LGCGYLRLDPGPLEVLGIGAGEIPPLLTLSGERLEELLPITANPLGQNVDLQGVEALLPTLAQLVMEDDPAKSQIDLL
jgi:hypothetical protein